MRFCASACSIEKTSDWSGDSAGNKNVGAPLDITFRKKLSNLVLPRYSLLLDRMNWCARWTETIRQNANCPKFVKREGLYRYVDAEYFGAGQQPLDYFEFGVFEGRSVKFWAALNGHPQSRFFGFDSFEGLPEEWNRDNPAGFYSANGKIPQLDDARVQFVVGWFQNSLPSFLASYQQKNRLLIHSDSDLYSSTLYSLTAMNALIVPGTIIIFDEFYDPVHEYRALQDYASAYMRKYEIVAATHNYVQAAIRLK